MGAVALTYNLQGVAQPLRFSSEVIAGIFLGKLKRWDDPAIKADNPGVSLPAADITPVYRSDGSGTSAVFTDYLSKVSPEWKEKVGTGTSPKWPAGLGAGAGALPRHLHRQRRRATPRLERDALDERRGKSTRNGVVKTNSKMNSKRGGAGRRVVNTVMAALTAACAFLGVAILLLILGYVAWRGFSSLSCSRPSAAASSTSTSTSRLPA